MKTLVYCGAHHGNTFAEMIERFDRAIAFEPHPYCLASLQYRFHGISNVTIVGAACGETDGTAIFHPYGDDDGSGSLGTININAAEILGHEDLLKGRPAIGVRVVNLDRWLDENRIDQIDTLITDAQGMDLTILQTLESRLATSRIRTFTSEVDHDDCPHYRGVPDNSRSAWAGFMARFPHYAADLSPWPLGDDLQRDVTFALEADVLAGR